jgi:hypothetical protein
MCNPPPSGFQSTRRGIGIFLSERAFKTWAFRIDTNSGGRGRNPGKAPGYLYPSNVGTCINGQIMVNTTDHREQWCTILSHNHIYDGRARSWIPDWVPKAEKPGGKGILNSISRYLLQDRHDEVPDGAQ